jgi:hypothetical protein
MHTVRTHGNTGHEVGNQPVLGLAVIVRFNAAEFLSPVGHQCRGTGHIVPAFALPFVLCGERLEIMLDEIAFLIDPIHLLFKRLERNAAPSKDGEEACLVLLLFRQRDS